MGLAGALHIYSYRPFQKRVVSFIPVYPPIGFQLPSLFCLRYRYSYCPPGLLLFMLNLIAYAETNFVDRPLIHLLF